MCCSYHPLCVSSFNPFFSFSKDSVFMLFTWVNVFYEVVNDDAI
jgi:hypothetical protein